MTPVFLLALRPFGGGEEEGDERHGSLEKKQSFPHCHKLAGTPKVPHRDGTCISPNSKHNSPSEIHRQNDAVAPTEMGGLRQKRARHPRVAHWTWESDPCLACASVDGTWSGLKSPGGHGRDLGACGNRAVISSQPGL
jgi:hypothetical protein